MREAWTSAEHQVVVRRVAVDASAPVIAAARLAAELGPEVSVEWAAESDVLRVAGPAPRLRHAVTAVIAETRFRGWSLSDDDETAGG
ncbi:hypothetical protein [Actinophytocola gossypii]|uniref:BON domain-containing protein n=1 Tax=Actinophytocola gossypii TaxID=2812003 RepID=A0ABT2JIK2_9PSEU|nr:hypothetical protein [Actinophytocola gossypii]MCT2587064.1 hypothetical protein [Actinophytocola gossypii]